MCISSAKVTRGPPIIDQSRLHAAESGHRPVSRQSLGAWESGSWLSFGSHIPGTPPYWLSERIEGERPARAASSLQKLAALFGWCATRSAHIRPDYRKSERQIIDRCGHPRLPGQRWPRRQAKPRPRAARPKPKSAAPPPTTRPRQVPMIRSSRSCARRRRSASPPCSRPIQTC